ncbi:hypothetical protein [Nitrospirillum bahiense]|uniref:Uncharacterized protein n=1 Tax=Nitrospirillum amazonense TaxID=28077 RepID=A0A560G1X3_9PROT|nr:hypothetical protein [Nitrospirillum amazonense]TWB27710.1 hypothetical protein FBZ88_106173 [Nitrospirillum amazonense]
MTSSLFSLGQIPKNTRLSAGCGGLQKIHPEFSIRIAAVYSIWNEIEVFLVVAYTALCGGDLEVSGSKYKKLPNVSAKRKAIEDISRSILTDSDLDEALYITKRMEEIGRERNRFAHSVLATSDDSPNRIFLLDPDKYSALCYSHENAVIKGLSLDDAHLVIYEKSETYDLDSMVRFTFEMEELKGRIIKFGVNMKHRHYTNNPHPNVRII